MLTMKKKIIAGLSVAFLAVATPTFAEEPEDKMPEKVDKVLIEQQKEEMVKMNKEMKGKHSNHHDEHIKKHAHKIISQVDGIEKEVYQLTKDVTNLPETTESNYIDQGFKDFDEAKRHIEVMLHKQQMKLNSYDNKIAVLERKAGDDNEERVDELYERIDEVHGDINFVYAKLDRLEYERTNAGQNDELKAPASELMTAVNGSERDVYEIIQEMDSYHPDKEGQFGSYEEAHDYFEAKLEQELEELAVFNEQIADLGESTGEEDNPRIYELYERVDELVGDIDYILAKLDRMKLEHELVNEDDQEEEVEIPEISIDPETLAALKNKLKETFEITTDIDYETNTVKITATNKYKPNQVFHLTFTKEQLERMTSN